MRRAGTSSPQALSFTSSLAAVEALRGPVMPWLVSAMGSHATNISPSPCSVSSMLHLFSFCSMPQSIAMRHRLVNRQQRFVFFRKVEPRHLGHEIERFRRNSYSIYIYDHICELLVIFSIARAAGSSMTPRRTEGFKQVLSLPLPHALSQYYYCHRSYRRSVRGGVKNKTQNRHDGLVKLTAIPQL